MLMVTDHGICIKPMISLQYLYCPQSWKSCPQFRKSEEARQKWSILTPKKVNMRAKKKTFPKSILTWTFCKKKRVQIGQFWPPWPPVYFTDAYRGSPPCTLCHHPDNRETGYSNVLLLASLSWSNLLPNLSNYEKGDCHPPAGSYQPTPPSCMWLGWHCWQSGQPNFLNCYSWQWYQQFSFHRCSL